MQILFSRYFLRVVISLFFLAASAVSLAPKPALATGIGPMYPTMGYAAMGPFQGNPYFPQQQCPMMGQMTFGGPCGVDPMAVYMGLNWSGSQRLGASYIPPIGLGAMFNDLNHGSLSRQMGGTAAY